VLDAALRDLERVAALLDGWLRVARRTSLAGEEVDIDQLAGETAARAGAQLVSRSPGTLVRGDRRLLERVFENLFENARNAGASAIRVAVQAMPDEVSIHVEDDGCGVAPEDAERVFTAGWSGRGGAGLGLFAVASTVDAHRGRVRCVPLARGTRFSVTLPRAEQRHSYA
jgi:signal transduction histidine kinase